MSALEVRDSLYWVGALDPDLRVFDVVMYTDYGTTYNSYILKTEEGNILFETAKVKYFEKYISNIKEVCSLESIKYIVVDHTEPDHAGSLEKLLDLIPDVKVLGSLTALNFLTEICNREIPGIAVDDGDSIKLGGKTLEFLSVPFLHWPDSIYTYIVEDKTLVTCDSFGCHYSDEKVFNDLIDGDFTAAYKYYFDMIMGPFKSHVQYALDKIKDFDIETICPGHGPVLRSDLQHYIDLYDNWSTEPPKVEKKKPLVVAAYVSAYGYTEELAKEITDGVKEIIDSDVELYDMVHADEKNVISRLKEAEGILLGTPTVNGDALPPITSLAANLNGILDGGKVAAAFGSFGWSGEGPDLINSRLNLLRMETIEPPLKVNFKPSHENLDDAGTFGRRFGKKLKEIWEFAGRGKGGKIFWKCTVCGEIFEGPLPPVNCPVCGVSADAFVEVEMDIVEFESEKALKTVIIGSGAAAVSAAEAIRKRNEKAEITIYTEEELLPYYRPVLSEMINSDVGDDEFYINNKNFYNDMKIDVKLNSKVLSVNKDKKIIVLEDNSEVSYDKLLIATGATPFIPPFTGKDLEGVYTLRNSKDLSKIKNIISENECLKMTVIGGGLLGLEMACSLANKGCPVTVIDTAPTILPRQTDSNGSNVLQNVVENSKIKVITGVMVEQIYGEGKVNGVILNSGEDIKADVVLVSAGLAPSISLASEAGLKCERAIVVNERMETSDPDIYAAGDCSVTNGKYYGVWEPALAQGRVAGANMVGDRQGFSGKLYPATLNAFDTSLLAIGNLHNDGTDLKGVKSISQTDEMRNIYRTLYFKDGKLDGALLLGDISKAASIISGVNENIDLEDCVERKILK